MGFDTSTTRPLLLVGDPGCGKTTTARYLTRWWLADTAHHAHIRTSFPNEWADLALGRHATVTDEPLGIQCGANCLVVVDNAAPLDDHWFSHLSRGTVRLILTCLSGHEWDQLVLPGMATTCLGLVREGGSDPAGAAVLDGQGRLDWPAHTVAVVPERRGPIDFPCHRWWVAGGCSSDRSAATPTHPSSSPMVPVRVRVRVRVPVPVLVAAAAVAATVVIW